LRQRSELKLRADIVAKVPEERPGQGNAAITDALQLDGLRRARIGLLTDLFVLDPTDAEVATSVRLAIDEMKGLGAEVVEITIPDVKQHMNDGMVSNVDFKFDLTPTWLGVRLLRCIRSKRCLPPASTTNQSKPLYATRKPTKPEKVAST
jgi:Asp-tRNA(Asn)/Glu-tRNA(Gln) amidotransferase A subunit family amidase